MTWLLGHPKMERRRLAPLPTELGRKPGMMRIVRDGGGPSMQKELRAGKKLNFVILTLAWLGLVGLVSGCESNEDDAIFTAQNCLNRINSKNKDVNPCLSAVQGISSPQASAVRCSAYYLSQGFFDPARLANAMDGIKSSGPDALLAMTGTLAFSDDTAAQAIGFASRKELSEAALSECQASGSAGYAMIAATTRMGTVFSGALTPDEDGSVTLKPEDVENMSDTELGEAAAVIFDTYCTEAQATSDVCAQFASAVTDPDADPAVVGCEIKKYLNPAATCD